jgi:bifunctional NMN adenylyltransferase/nudix hydrolase
MILEKFPKIKVFYINDTPKDDVLWSNNLDRIIEDNLIWGDIVTEITIFGSQDTVINKYKGKHNTVPFDGSSFIGPEELRRQATANYQPNEHFRAGVIAAQANRFPTAYQTVDIAIIDDHGRLLLGRKPNETKLRFIGGFSDPNSPSLEADARREAFEETGVEVDGIKYLASLKINDSRYQFEVDCIKTAFFVGKYIFGRPQGNDDIAEVKWVTIADLKKEDIIDSHHDLYDIFMEKFVKKNQTI